MKTLRFELDGCGLRVYLSPEGDVFVDAGDYIGRYHGGIAAEEVTGGYLKDYPASRWIRGRAVWTEETFFHVLWDESSPDEFGFGYLEKVIPAVREEIARLRDCEIARLQDCEIARLRDCEVARLRDKKLLTLNS